jgi:hypothetical protein
MESDFYSKLDRIIRGVWRCNERHQTGRSAVDEFYDKLKLFREFQEGRFLLQQLPPEHITMLADHTREWKLYSSFVLDRHF